MTEDLKLGGSELLVYAMIASNLNEYNEFIKLKATIAKDTGLSERTVLRCLNELKNYVQKFGKVVIVENSSYHAAANAYSKVDESIQNNLIKSSEIAVQIIAEFEPMIFEDSEVGIQAAKAAGASYMIVSPSQFE